MVGERPTLPNDNNIQVGKMTKQLLGGIRKQPKQQGLPVTAYFLIQVSGDLDVFTLCELIELFAHELFCMERILLVCFCLWTFLKLVPAYLVMHFEDTLKIPFSILVTLQWKGGSECLVCHPSRHESPINYYPKKAVLSLQRGRELSSGLAFETFPLLVAIY